MPFEPTCISNGNAKKHPKEGGDLRGGRLQDGGSPHFDFAEHPPTDPAGPDKDKTRLALGALLGTSKTSPRSSKLASVISDFRAYWATAVREIAQVVASNGV